MTSAEKKTYNEDCKRRMREYLKRKKSRSAGKSESKRPLIRNQHEQRKEKERLRKRAQGAQHTKEERKN